MNVRRALAVVFACLSVFAGGCATLQSDPLQVTVAGIEPLQGEGMRTGEFRSVRGWRSAALVHGRDADGAKSEAAENVHCSHD